METVKPVLVKERRNESSSGSIMFSFTSNLSLQRMMGDSRRSSWISDTPGMPVIRMTGQTPHPSEKRLTDQVRVTCLFPVFTSSSASSTPVNPGWVGWAGTLFLPTACSSATRFVINSPSALNRSARDTIYACLCNLSGTTEILWAIIRRTSVFRIGSSISLSNAL